AQRVSRREYLRELDQRAVPVQLGLAVRVQRRVRVRTHLVPLVGAPVIPAHAGIQGRRPRHRRPAGKARQAFSKTSLPPSAPTRTVSPPANPPSRTSRASGLPTCCWIARFSGRAP